MKVGEFLVDSLQVEQLPSFCIRSFSVFPEKVSNRLPVFHIIVPPPSQSGKALQVFQIHITCWTPDGQCSNLKSIVDTISEMTKFQRRSSGGPVVVHCRCVA